jgi:acyl-CoA dehydrogenase
VDFVRQRKAFGKRIADFQNTQFKLAALKAELEITECYVDRCVQRLEAGELGAEAAAVAKLYASELLGRVVDEGVQLHGGAGYMDEYVISRLYTDARITRIFAGSSEVMKLIIGRDLLADGKVAWIERER